MKITNRISLQGQFSNIEDYNSNFKKVKIKVHALGKNINGSDITLQAYTLAKNSIFNIPVVSKYTDANDSYGLEGDLEGHNTTIKQTTNGWDIYQDTFPIGVVSSDANITFEEINEGTEEVPDIKTYVVVDNVYLWKRYDATQKIEEWLENDIVPTVSMEIGNISGLLKDGIFQINSFEYEAICALGSNLIPAFKSARIEEYSHDTFKEQFFEMMKELKQSFSQNQSSNDVDITNQEGGKNVEIFKELFEKYSITKEQILEFNKDINFEKISVEDLEAKIIEFQKDEPEVFSLTAMQLRDLLKAKLNENAPLDEWGYTINPYYYLDHNESFVWAEERENNWVPVQFDYSLDGESVNISLDSKKICKWSLIPIEDDETGVAFSSERFEVDLAIKGKELEKQFNEEKNTLIADYQAKLEEANDKYTQLEETSEELKQFQANKLKEERELAETELFEKFSTQLSKEEIENIKENSAQFTLEQLEDKLFVLVGKKNANFSVKKDKGININLIPDENPKYSKSWAKLMEV